MPCENNDYKEYRDFALKVYEKIIVLLKNQNNKRSYNLRGSEVQKGNSEVG